MGVLDTIFKIFGFTRIGNGNVINERVGLVQKNLLTPQQDSQRSIDLKQPELVSTIYQIAKLLGEFLSRIPIDVYSTDAKGNRVINAKHAWYYSLKYQPNSYTSKQQFIQILISHLVFRGNAFAYINPDKTLSIIHPDLVVAAKVYKGDLYYWVKKIADDGTVSDIPVQSSELIHLKFASTDGIFGINPVQSLSVQLNTNYKGNKTVEGFFSKNATSTKYFQQIPGANGKVGNQSMTELIKQFSEKVSGWANSFNFFTVPEGFEIKELGLNTELVKFLDSGRITRNEIASVYGVPVFFLNTENTAAIKFEEANLSLLVAIENLTNIFKSEFEAKLLTKMEKLNGTSIEWNYWKLNQTNLLDKANALKQASTAGAISPNEYARQLNLPVSDNPMMDYHWIQSQNVPIETYGSETNESNDENSEDNNPEK